MSGEISIVDYVMRQTNELRKGDDRFNSRLRELFLERGLNPHEVCIMYFPEEPGWEGFIASPDKRVFYFVLRSSHRGVIIEGRRQAIFDEFKQMTQADMKQSEFEFWIEDLLSCVSRDE